MRRLPLATLLVALAFAAAGACTRRPEPLPPGADARAVALADRVMDALGGRERWDAVKGIRWTFGSMLGDSVRSSRRHAWDRVSGRHRVDYVDREGRACVIVHVVGDTTSGAAWVGGQSIEAPDSLHKLIRRGEALWVNDTYWMLMPYKLRDPGVHLAMAPDTTMDGTRYECLALSFDQVGLTPGDHYWVFVNPSNHRVERWAMVLQGNTPPPVSYTWEGWESHDGLWFPTAHRRDSLNVFTNQVELVAGFDPAEFEQP